MSKRHSNKGRLNRYRDKRPITGKDVSEFLGTMDFLGTMIGNALNQMAKPKPGNDTIDIDYEEIKPKELPPGK